MNMFSTRQTIMIFAPAISVLAAAAMMSIFFQISIPTMTMDTAALAKIHPLSGILSNLGILLWCATTSICFFSAAILYNKKPSVNCRFLFFSSFLSAYLLVDDFFQFHEVLAPQYFGLNEKIVYAFLGVATSVYLFTFRHVILKTNFSVLLLSLGFLASSVVIDSILEPWLWRLGHWVYFFEDGTKWLGIVSWCSYYIHTSYQFLVKTMRSA